MNCQCNYCGGEITGNTSPLVLSPFVFCSNQCAENFLYGVDIPSPPNTPQLSIPQPLQQPTSAPVTITALHLPANALNPVFVPVVLWPRTDANGSTHWIPDLTSIFSLTTSVDSYVFDKQVSGTYLRRPLQLFYRAGFRSDGSEPNQCIRNMVNGRPAHPWAGDLVVLKFRGKRMEAYCDMSDNDIIPLVYWFLHHTFSLDE
ncbi:hypothetical protein FRC08_002089 [Ceratobasidium sp. 394]|nr:hypothetical protein FRC08_002089 [Ceratobasidium sp. 394]